MTRSTSSEPIADAVKAEVGDPEAVDTHNEEQAGLPEAPVETEEELLLPGWAVEGEDDATKEARQDAIRAAYSKAQTKLRETYLEQFNAFVISFAKDAGYEWKPKPTKAEKARAELRRLLEENPDLLLDEELQG